MNWFGGYFYVLSCTWRKTYSWFSDICNIIFFFTLYIITWMYDFSFPMFSSIVILYFVVYKCVYAWLWIHLICVWLLSIDEMMFIFMVGKLMRMHKWSHKYLQYSTEYALCNEIDTNALGWLFLGIWRKIMNMTT